MRDTGKAQQDSKPVRLPSDCARLCRPCRANMSGRPTVAPLACNNVHCKVDTSQARTTKLSQTARIWPYSGTLAHVGHERRCRVTEVLAYEVKASECRSCVRTSFFMQERLGSIVRPRPPHTHVQGVQTEVLASLIDPPQVSRQHENTTSTATGRHSPRSPSFASPPPLPLPCDAGRDNHAHPGPGHSPVPPPPGPRLPPRRAPRRPRGPPHVQPADTSTVRALSSLLARPCQLRPPSLGTLAAPSFLKLTKTTSLQLDPCVVRYLGPARDPTQDIFAPPKEHVQCSHPSSAPRSSGRRCCP